MNSKMATNSELSTIEPKKTKQKQPKQITRTGTESQKWRSDRGLPVGTGSGGAVRRGIKWRKNGTTVIA